MDSVWRLTRGLLALAGLLFLAACASLGWKRDPEVRAAKRACQGLGEAERYTCVERHAVEKLDPDICRLTGIWIDDMCLQAVYEAANDPAICDRLYLEGVRPLCRAFYAQRSAVMWEYSDSALGFAVSLPRGWVAGERRVDQDPLGRDWSVVEFAGDLRPYGAQALDLFGIRVSAGPSTSSTLTEAVQLILSPLARDFRERVEVLCCRKVGGEEATELLYFPPTRWGNRRMVVLHQGWEYHLDFYPLYGLTPTAPTGVEAQVAFDAFVRTFAFLPLTETPEPTAPAATPAPASAVGVGPAF
jgi:hypothetical protein